MRIIRFVTLEEREDKVWRPWALDCFIYSNRDSEVETWARWWLAPFVYLWYYFTAILPRRYRRWRRRRDKPPAHFQTDLLNEAIKSERDMDNARLEAVRSYVRNLPPET